MNSTCCRMGSVALCTRAARTAASDATPPPARCCPVVELRQYTLHPGQRDSLIALFDREFVETQEATGMQLVAQFRDIDRPDVFTWVRGFADMPSRAASLAAFYGGPVWAAHRQAAAQGFSAAFERVILPELVATGVRPAAMLETESSANTFPQLPVREGEHAFVWFAQFADGPAYDRWKASLEGSQRWRERVRPVLDQHLGSPTEVWQLTPTARSRPIR